MNCCSMTTREAAKLIKRANARARTSRRPVQRALHHVTCFSRAVDQNRPDIEEDASPPVALDSLAGCA